jgi:hypothetical protein
MDVLLALVVLVSIVSLFTLASTVMFIRNVCKLIGGEMCQFIREQLWNQSSAPFFAWFWIIIFFSVILLEFSFFQCYRDASHEKATAITTSLVLSGISVIVLCRALCLFPRGRPSDHRPLLSIPVLSIVSLLTTAGACFCLLPDVPVLGGAAGCLIGSLLCGALTAGLGSWETVAVRVNKLLREFLHDFPDLGSIRCELNTRIAGLTGFSDDMRRLTEYAPKISASRTARNCMEFAPTIAPRQDPQIQDLVGRLALARAAEEMVTLTDGLNAFLEPYATVPPACQELVERFRALYRAAVAFAEAIPRPADASANEVVEQLEGLFGAFRRWEDDLNARFGPRQFDALRSAGERIATVAGLGAALGPVPQVRVNLISGNSEAIRARFGAAVEAARRLEAKIRAIRDRREGEKQLLEESDFMDVWFLQIRTDEKIDALANLHECECDAIMDYYEGELAKLGPLTHEGETCS